LAVYPAASERQAAGLTLLFCQLRRQTENTGVKHKPMAVVPGPAAVGAAPEGNGLPRQNPAAIVEQLRQIAARVLDVDPVHLDPDRSLLALGVDSLAAAEMAGAIETDFAVRVSLVSLIEGASLADLAGEIASALAATRAAGASVGDSAEAEAAAGRGEAPGRYAVSRGQQALLLLDRLVPGGNPAYVMAGAARVLSGWDRERFVQALAVVVARHAALRTTFGAAGESFEREVHAAGPWQLEERDAAGWSEAALAAGMAEVAHRPFDLERGPLLRVAVFQCAAGERLLVFAVHHLVADFASIGMVLAELGALYSRRRDAERWPGPAPAAGSYGAYVRAQEAALAGPEGERLRSYWHRNLGRPDGRGGALPVLSLPADRPRPPVPSFQGGTRRLRLPREVCERLQSLGSASGSTRFMTLLAGFVALLHRHGGQPEVLVGTPASGRGRAERAGLVGYLVNPVVVRGDASGEPTFMELLGRVRESALGAFAHQEYPLARLAEELAGERDAGRPALFQAMFVLYRERSPGERGLAALALGEAGARFALGGLALESAALPRRSAQFDLTLLMADLDSGLAGALQYNSDLFDGATIERLAGHLCTLLAAVALPVAPGGGAVAGGMGGAGAHQRLGELPLLTAGERQQLLEWNATAAVYPAPACLHELIAAQARRTPLAVAVEAEAGEVAWQGGGVWESLTYRELDARAERLARRLRRLGVGAETVVAICAERSLALMVGLLGILKAGGAYLPLDPGYPPERLDYMLRDSGAPVLLAQEHLRAAVVARLQAPPGGTVWLDASPATPGRETPSDESKAANAGAGTGADTADGLAYVIYTSGSTGRPKGTMNTHRGIVNRLLWMQDQYRLEVSDRVLQKTPASFDVSVWELFWPLLAGARLVMAAPGGHRDSAYLLRILGERQITTLHFVPAMLAVFLEHVATLSGPRPPALRSLRRVMASGEALPWGLQQRCHALLGAPLYNLYGPTEAAVDVTHWACAPADEPAAAASAQNPAVPAAVSVVPIGRPVANTRIHLLDRAAREAPIGLPAELYIGGVQLARGYLGRPDLTAERFVADPLAGVAGPAGSRLYRTGDVARYRADGAIEYLGRTDDQVKIRGFRIELGEIEAALLRHPEVREAVVIVRGTDAPPGAPLPGRGVPDDRWLVVYLVLAAGQANQGTAVEGVRLSLRESLPEQMLPAAFVVLPALPLTASGKVDRRALPAPERAGGGTEGSARRSVPRTPTERVLARLWADVLAAAPAAGEGGGPRVAVEDSFFELGGHSLLATRLVSRIWQAFGVELPLHRLFEHPTLAAMARAIDEGAATPRAAGSGGAAPILAGAPREPAAALPLSFAQERIWFVEQLHPGTIAYNVPGALRLTGELGVRGHAALAASLNEIVRRHDVLRSVYSRAAGSDRPGQVILPFAAAPLALVDLSGLGAAAVAAGDDVAAALGRRPFDLATGPLLRTALLRRSAAEHVLVVVLHHIVADGWSVAIFQRELAALYAALSSHPAAAVLPDLPLQYADYARWLRSWLAGEVLAGHLAYWRQALAGAPAQLSLPADRPRPSERNGRGGRTRVWLPAAQVVGLQTAARRHGATLFMVLLAAFDVLLARLSRQDDVVVGSPVANRGRVEIEALIGCFVNTLALRVDLAGRPAFAALLAQVRQRCLEAYAHQDMPFEKLVEALAPQRDLGATPIFQVMLVLQSAWGAEGVAASPAAPGAAAGSQPSLAMELAEIEIGVAKFDLTLEAVESGAGLRLTLGHSADLFDAATAKRLAGHYLNLLAALAGGAADAADAGAAGGGTVAAVGEPAAWQSGIAGLAWLSAAERQQLREWNATAAAYDGGDRCLHELVEEQVRRTPEAVAVVADATGPTGQNGGPQSLTYAALSSAANRLARHLRGRGVGPETVVAISAERSLGLVVGILAILKAGGAYLPLDSDYPRERLLYMLDDAGARILLTHGEPTARLAAGNGDAARRIETLRIDAPGAPWRRRSGKDLPRSAGGAAPENLAYVIYTSGSTGRPKGAMNTHRGIVNQLLWRQQRFGLSADDRMLQKTPASFDVSVWEMFSALLVGGRVVMARPGGHRDAPYLWQVLAAQEITKVHFVPAMLAMFLEEAAAGRSLPSLPALRRILVGGEALSPELRQRCREVLPAPLHNLYGPTETAVDVTFWACAPPAVAVVPIGRPLANTRIHLLDRDGREAPIGVPADLFIGGIQVGRGYLGRPQLTAERFVPDPFGEPGSRLYATGDVARYLLDGAIDYLGRADGQVKIRGFRIELGEIETALRRHPAVREAMVNVVEGPAPGAGAAVRRLVAYVVAADPSQAQLGAVLRQALADRLPEHMMPAAFVVLPGLPLLPSGKVDRKALPAPDWHGGAASGERTAPRSPLERALAALWAEVLGFAPAADGASDRDSGLATPDPAAPAIAIEDSFFDLGGHSLLATRLLSRVRLAFGVELSLRRLFEAPRLGAMAREIGALGAAMGPPPLSRRPAGTEAPLSYAQERLWLVAQLTPGSTAYNLSGVLRLSGPFDGRDLAALVWSLNQIVRRHEVLRSAYPVTRGGVPVQVAAPFVAFDLPLVDVSALGGTGGRRPPPDSPQIGAAAAAASRVAAALGSRPFDLSRGPLMRMALVRLGSEEHRLILVLHHIVADGWAVGVFLRELAALHRALANGGESRLPELAVQYADYAHWQRSWLRGEALDRLLVYWRQVLGGAPAKLTLATDRPRPAVARFRGAVVAESLQAGLAEELRRGARQRGTTLFMVLLAAFDVLLARLSGQEDIVVGSPIANRERLEIEGLVGCFVNTLVLRTDLAGRPSFAELLARARQVCLGAYAHQDMPFEKLVEALAPQRDLVSTPLFQVMLVLQNTWTVAAAAPAAATLSGGPFPVTDSALPAELRAGLAMELAGIEIGIAKFDLTLQAAETRGGLSLSFEYSSDLFDATTVKRLAGSFQALLAAVAGGAWDDKLPALPCLSAAQRQQLLLEWNATAARYGSEDRLLHEQFSRQAARTPDAVAVAAGLVAGAMRLSYAELDRQASRLARRLRAQGVGPEVLVGLCVERTVGLVVGILGILKAGGAYLPLDPAHPEARLRYLLADAGAPVVVAEEALLDRLPAGSHRVVLLAPDGGAAGPAEGEEPCPAVLPENPAYVIYTSGSTGRPKGVVVSHRNVSRLFAVTAPLFGFGPGDVWTLFHSFAFDFSVWELWGALLYGGRVVVVPYWVSRSPEAFRELLVRQGVTRLSQTPSAFHQLSRVAGEGELAVRSVVLGGEALEPRSLLPWLEREGETARLVNMYGITETTVHVTYRELFAAEVDRLPGSVIGRPLGDLATYVLDWRGELSPLGVVGELYVGGEGLARGYLGRPGLTAERFVPHPFAAAGGARLYRTGDLGRYLASGELEYLGRMDTQVKIRGFRIEMGEVEAALAAHPDVQAAAVLVREDRPGDRRLVAYVVPRHGAPDADGAAGASAAIGAAAGLDAAALRRYLMQRLPEPMLPAAWVTLAALPLTANGKVDRSALGQIVPETRRTAGELLAPRTPAEELLAAIWAQVLGRERVGVEENFFELGGHSLLAVRMVAELRHRAGVELPLARLFALPRLEDLAREVEALARSAGSLLAPIRHLPPETRDLPLSFAQERLWFLDRLDPGRATYNLAGNLHFAGRLDTGALAAGLAEIRRRHQVLCTRFAELPGGGVAARLAPDAGDPALAAPALPLIDLGGLPGRRRAAVAAALAAAEARRPFDLALDPLAQASAGRAPQPAGLLRAFLVRLATEGGEGGERKEARAGEAEHRLSLTLHHIVADGWSIEVLARELAVLYQAAVERRPPAPGALPELPIQYADFAAWQRERLRGDTLERELAYWRGQLAGPSGPPPPLDLAGDRPRPAAASGRGGRRVTPVPRHVAGALAELAQRRGATLFMALLAAFDTLLLRHTGQSDVTVGTPVANRSQPEVQNLVGLFVNTLVLRLDLAGDPPFAELLGRARQVALAAYDHQDVPFDKLVSELAPRRGTAETPFFQVVLALQGALPALSLPGLAVRLADPGSDTAKFDLSLAFSRLDGGGLAGVWIYRTDLFDPATIERLGGQLQTLLAALTGTAAGVERRLSELPLLDAAARHQLLHEWSLSIWDEGGEDLLHAPFERQAAAWPAAIALVDWDEDGEERTLTYGELAAWVERLTRRLVARGVGPEHVVGICAEASFALVAGLLAILKAGGAYLPLDPALPPERLAQLLADAAAHVVLAAPEVAGRLPATLRPLLLAAAPLDRGAEALDRGAEAPATHRRAPGPDNAAYVLYTSGSTGQPKGVVVPHRAVVNRLRFQADADLAAGARVLQRTRLSFDVSIVEIFAPLWTGGAVVLTRSERQQDVSYLARLLAGARVTNANLPPALLPALLAEEAFLGCRSLRRLITGGDRVPGDLGKRYAAAMAAAGNDAAPPLLARYGPTEATISVSEWPCGSAPDGQIVPLGRPIAGARLYILDRALRAVPPGAPGELCVAGICLARGYLARPDLTAAAFAPLPFPRGEEEAGGRLYRTGDLARQRADGAVEFLGRIDRQVKIRGFRLELGEVEAALTRHPAVAEAVAIGRDDPGTAGKRLVAYVVARAGARFDGRLLRTFLEERLPAYMVPSAIVELPRLPLTANGKLDRQALPAPAWGPAGGSTPPRTPVEELLADLWAEVLEVDRAGLGIEDSFFDLGGHSLLATRLVSRLRQTFGVEVPLRLVFEQPALGAMARAITGTGVAAAASLPPLSRRPAGEPAVLSFAQERIWFLDQLAPGSAAYNMPGALRLRGRLGAPERRRLARSLGEIVRRHEVLRSS
jgi:amino acid adenylation domain-containing protein